MARCLAALRPRSHISLTHSAAVKRRRGGEAEQRVAGIGTVLELTMKDAIHTFQVNNDEIK